MNRLIYTIACGRRKGGRVFFNIFLSFFLSFFLSCSDSKEGVLFGLSFDEMKELASKENKPFCVILSTANCDLCQTFVNVLSGEKYRKFLKKAYFVVLEVDQEENEWYQEWSMNLSFPSTYVFSPIGELKAIIPGSVVSSFECVGNVLNGDLAGARFMYRHRFGNVNSDRVISMLNDILKCKYKLERGEDISEEIDKTISLMPYPYNLYLKYLNEKKEGNNESATQIAERILTYSEVLYYHIYGKMHHRLKKDIYTDIEIDSLPQLEVDAREITLDGCKKDVSQLFRINLTNKGMKMLSISDISTSCSCLKLGEGEKDNIEINPGASVAMSFVFTPDAKGLLRRDIIIYSNAINPLLEIVVRADVY